MQPNSRLWSHLIAVIAMTAAQTILWQSINQAASGLTPDRERERDRETGNDMYAMQRGLSPDEDHWRRLTDSVDSRNEK